MADTQILVIAKGLERFTETAIKRLALEVTANCVESTPVKTGWAKANWVPQIGSPNLTPASNEADPASVPGAISSQGAAIVSIGAYTLARGDVYVTNNVPYILELNDGSSAQAPAGFVQSGIAKAINTVERTTK